MLISRTPYRISFFGGGTDYPDWYLKNEGAVLSTTIDKYCYITCRKRPPFFDNKHLIVWSHIEAVSHVSEILHPAVREGIRYLNMDNDLGIEIHHQGDLPARAGMGSSSSFAVGLIKALLALQGKMIGKHDLALKAIELEQSVLKENVGSQDQIAAAYGGFNYIRFLKNGKIKVEPMTIPSSRIQDLESHLLLFYTGTSRLASEIAVDLIKNLDNKKRELHTMREMVDKAISILNSDQSLDDFGRLLHENWLLKRSTSHLISPPLIDSIYNQAIEKGALGGKLLGAGASGFMVFYVPIDKQEDVKTALQHYLHVPFKFDNDGSSIIYYTGKD